MDDNLSDRGNMSLSDTEAADVDNERVETNENAEDDETGRRVDPETSKKRVVRNPLPKLNPERLKGPKGIQTIEKYFEGFKFHGRGHEKRDLGRVMKRLEHWAHRLFPKYQFDDFLERVEVLGSKKELQTFITKYRHDMLTDDLILEETENDDLDNRQSPEPQDEMDLFIDEQIKKNRQNVSHINQTSTQNMDEVFDSLREQPPEPPANNVAEKPPNPPVPEEDEEAIKQRIERNRKQAILRRLEKIQREKSQKNNAQQSKELEKSSVNASNSSAPTTSRVPAKKPTEITIQNDVEPTEIEKKSSKSTEKVEKVSNKRPIDDLDREIDDVVDAFMNKKR